MTPIVSTKDVPLELGVRQQFSISRHESTHEVTHILTQKMARMLAEKIIAESRFFELKIEGSYGTLMSDVIVMTRDEFFDLALKKFREGVDHAQGFMPKDWELK